MKKQNVSLLVFLLATSSLFFSCGNSMNKNVGALEFDSLQVNETAHLFGDTARPACNLIIDFTRVVKSSDEAMKDSLNAHFLSACLGEKYMDMTPEEAIEAYKDKYVSEYRKDLEPLYEKDKQNSENEADIQGWYSYYQSIDSRIQLYSKWLLTYCINYNEYTGGAHGIYTATFLNFDLRTLRLLQLDDLFATDYREALTDLLWNQLMADNQVASRQELEDMGYTSTGELEPTENFYLSKEGISFYYNVYEIAPYVMGPVCITLPYEMVRPLLAMNLDF